MKAYRTVRGVAPLLLQLVTRWSGQLYVPAILPPVKNPGAHLIGGWVGLRHGVRNPAFPVCSLVTVPNTLSRLLHVWGMEGNSDACRNLAVVPM